MIKNRIHIIGIIAGLLMGGVIFLPASFGTEIPDESQNKIFRGTVKTGAQLGEVRQYCPQGLYLVASEGSYLVNQTTMLQLRISDEKTGTKIKMLSDQKYIGKKVEVVGKYPAQEVFCEALICDCDSYILVRDIRITE
ncbi:MAG: hypothetical protein HZA08_03725 [Nitrospirae bacterium]|nr:hypothetical protein [Nitrospirota bacterium]